MPEKRITRITWLVLPIIIWTFAGGPAYAALAATEQAREVAREQARNALPRDFDDVVAELSSALNGVRDGDDDALDKAMALRAEIRDRDSALQQEFADVEAMIKDKNLPEEILQRHRDFVNEYQKRLATVETNLSKVEQGAVTPDGFFERAWFNTRIFFTGDPVREEAAADAAELMKSFQPKKVRKSFKPEDLPFRRLTPQKDLKPKETAEEWRRALEPTAQTSAISKALGAVGDAIIPQAMAQTSDLPGPADLAESIEVQFTPEIMALAAQLNNNPVEIYNWVRNNIKFVPVWGSIQGGDYCRQTRICNAFDTASLLIALLRASGISAQYEFGTIEIDSESARNWLGGFDDLEAAGRFAAAGGTPTTLYSKLDGSQTLRLDHVWVRAYIDYIPSQGAVNVSPDTWISMDPSYKLYVYGERVDPNSLVSSDIDQLFTDMYDSAVVDADGALTSINLALVSQLPQQLNDELTTSLNALGPIDTVADFLHFPELQVVERPLLAASSDYDIVTTGLALSDIPASLRHTLTIRLSTPDLIGGVTSLDHTTSLPELAGKRVSLGFDAASDVDRDAIGSLLDSLNGDVNSLPVVFPATALNFIGELRIDGQVVATGPAMRIGTVQQLEMTFSAPGAPGIPVVNEINVGEFVAIGIDLTRISEQQMLDHAQDLVALESRINAYTGAPGEELPFDGDIRADYFAAIVDSWFASVDFFKEGTYHDAGAAWARYPSAGLFFADIAPEPLFGVPWRVRSTGLVMDIDRNLSVAESRIGRADLLRNVTIVHGIIGSSLESQLPLKFMRANPEFQGPAVAFSAVDVIFRALQDGIPILTLTTENFDALKSRLAYDGDTFNDISNAVAAGNTVVVPETAISDAGQFFFGYIILDEETGGGDYIVGQSFSGGILKMLLALFSGIAGLMLSAGEEAATSGTFWKSAAKWFPFAGIALEAMSSIYSVATNEEASTEQKVLAITFVLLFAFVAASVSFALLAATGGLAALLGFTVGLALGALLDVILRSICTCFAWIFGPLPRRRLEDEDKPLFARGSWLVDGPFRNHTATVERAV